MSDKIKITVTFTDDEASTLADHAEELGYHHAASYLKVLAMAEINKAIEEKAAKELVRQQVAAAQLQSEALGRLSRIGDLFTDVYMRSHGLEEVYNQRPTNSFEGMECFVAPNHVYPDLDDEGNPI